MVERRENIKELFIEEEMKDSYLSYAMSVIMSRALPDVRDGLKPSQRRILVAMNDLGLGPRSKSRKCAKIAGDTTGNYHPHGEQVVYPTLVRMAQDFNYRYPLIKGQGNFGSIDGDPPAAMRYTEARMTEVTMILMEDIERRPLTTYPTMTIHVRNRLSFHQNFQTYFATAAQVLQLVWQQASRRIMLTKSAMELPWSLIIQT